VKRKPRRCERTALRLTPTLAARRFSAAMNPADSAPVAQSVVRRRCRHRRRNRTLHSITRPLRLRRTPPTPPPTAHSVRLPPAAGFPVSAISGPRVCALRLPSFHPPTAFVYSSNPRPFPPFFLLIKRETHTFSVGRNPSARNCESTAIHRFSTRAIPLSTQFA
jgi:hypothetical protein